MNSEINRTKLNPEQASSDDEAQGWLTDIKSCKDAQAEREKMQEREKACGGGGGAAESALTP